MQAIHDRKAKGTLRVSLGDHVGRDAVRILCSFLRRRFALARHVLHVDCRPTCAFDQYALPVLMSRSACSGR